MDTPDTSGEDILSGARRAVLCAPLPMFLCSDRGKILAVSRPLLEWTGYRHEDFPTCEAMFSKTLAPDAVERLQQLPSGHTDKACFHQGAFEVTTRSGGTRCWDYWVSSLGPTASGTLYLWAAVDITAQRKAEQEAHITLREVQSREAALEEVVREREEILSSVSHDMKTPLTALQLRLDSALMKSGAEFSEQRAVLHSVQQQVDRLARMVDSILERDSHRDRPLTPIELDGLLREVVALMEPTVRKSGSTLTYEGLPGLVISGERLPLENAFLNLLSNAVKYAPGRLEMYLSPKRGQAEIVVQDYGPGIPEESQAVIFDPYVRLNGNREGLGLGLYLTRKTIENLGGSITVESKVEEGSSFTVCLPLAG